MWPADIGEAYHEPSRWPYYTIAVLAIYIVLGLLVSTFYNIYQRISPDLRNVSSTQLWLSLIPTFGSIWIFYVIWQAANAMSEEFKRRKIVEFETYPGLGIGWAFAFFSATAQLTLLIDEPVITILLYIATVVLLIIFWIKLSGFKNKLDQDNLREMQQNLQPQIPFPPYQPPQQQWPPQQQSPYPPMNFPPPPEQPYQPPNDLERWKPK